MRRADRIASRLILGVIFTAHPSTNLAATFLTGVVEDSGAQTIEMPRLAGAWQVQIAWMAPEGQSVNAGDPVVRVDPGTLIAQEEEARTELDKKRLEGRRRLDELALEVLDAEAALADARSAVTLARIDARIPKNTIPNLDFETYQLALATSLQNEDRTMAELAAKRLELEGAEREVRLEVDKAEAQWRRFRDSLARTEIAADKDGFLIYGENRMSGRKVFPGDTLNSGMEIAAVASREGLQFRFWVHEADIHSVPVGTSLTVTADSVTNIRIAATVSWIASQAIEREDWSAGGYFEMLATPESTLPNAFMPGMAILGASAP
ncbi:MAG: HlyD family efflux transporter periplasmic adaptor subunit [Pseudomonadota bacterium]